MNKSHKRDSCVMIVNRLIGKRAWRRSQAHQLTILPLEYHSFCFDEPDCVINSSGNTADGEYGNNEMVLMS